MHRIRIERGVEKRQPARLRGIGASGAAQGGELHEDVIGGDPVGGQVAADGPGEHEMVVLGDLGDLLAGKKPLPEPAVDQVPARIDDEGAGLEVGGDEDAVHLDLVAEAVADQVDGVLEFLPLLGRNRPTAPLRLRLSRRLPAAMFGACNAPSDPTRRRPLEGNRPTVPLLASLALGVQAIFSAGGGDCFCRALKAAAQTEGRSCSSADSSAGLINGRRLKTSCR